jgi:hypothetical protein
VEEGDGKVANLGGEVMRRIAAFMAILTALSGAFAFVGGMDWVALITGGAFAIALAAGGIAALFGGDLIYLASSWGLFVGMNLAAYVDVMEMLSKNAAQRNFVAEVGLSGLLILGLIGLLLTLLAHRSERRT